MQSALEANLFLHKAHIAWKDIQEIIINMHYSASSWPLSVKKQMHTWIGILSTPPPSL